jgi:protocatechuate 3,4-dioxygenase beta subunit
MEAHYDSSMGIPTQEQVSGPFYPVQKPRDQDTDLTVIHGKKGKAQGQVIYITGRVLNLEGKPIAGAQVEIWQANSFGRYTHPSDTNPAPLDPNFEGYCIQKTDKDGRYQCKTIKPGPYPVPSGRIRPPHIHFIVTSTTNRLITQLYFDGDPLNEKDIFFGSAENKESILVKLMPPAKDQEPGSKIVEWDIILRQ